MKFFQPVFDFIKKNPAILYSMVLIVVVPVFLFGFSFFLLDRFQVVIDTEFKNKAFLILTTLEAFSRPALDDPAELQKQIEVLTQQSATIQSITFSYYKQDQETFQIVAASDKSLLGRTLTPDEDHSAWQRHRLAWGTENVIGAVITPAQGNRYWVALKALRGSSGQKQAVVQIALSLAGIDAQLAQLRQVSLYVLIAIALILVLLVANHARLFEYAKLFRDLQDVDRAKDEFISIASHELRNPITGIANFLELVQEGDYGPVPPNLQQPLNSVKIQADNLKDLVQDLLDVSRIQQGRLEVELELADINPLIKQAVAAFQEPAREKNLELKMDLAADLPRLKIDKRRFREVIHNLLSNAIKYTKEGWVEVRTKLGPDRRQALIEVEDSGIGMSAMEREKLFQKFYRIRPREAADVSGTGLGLWISKNLVELMSGRIYVESIKGKGTRFTLAFPVPKSQDA